MKIACILPTRGKASLAAASIEIAAELASGQHEIVFVVALDSDDIASQSFFNINYPGIILSVEPRPEGYGALWNRCATLAEVSDADVFVALSTDIFITAPNWDQLIGMGLQKSPIKEALIAWNDPVAPGLANQIIFSKEWVAHNGMFPEHFPFWFIDTWVDEVFSFATGSTIPIIQELTVTGKRGRTMRLRELDFWWPYFSARRGERMTQARIIQHRLMIEATQSGIDTVRKHWERRDESFKPMYDSFQKSIGDPGEPTPEYLSIKAKAEQWMKDNAAAASKIILPDSVSGLHH